MSDRKVDKTLEDTFPASDPPAHSGITGDDHAPKQPDKRNTEEPDRHLRHPTATLRRRPTIRKMSKTNSVTPDGR